jgi:uncharacterized membrane protein SpoIIM required for sporulation
MSLKSSAFRAEREASWRELERVLALVERKGIRGVEAGDLSRLPALYRATISSLSVARAISLDRNLLDYLEALCGRAYLAVYGSNRHLSEALADFYLRRFPQAVRTHRWHIALAFGLLIAGALVGASVVARDAERFYSFVQPEYAQGRGPTASTELLRDALYAPAGTAKMLKSFAMFLFSHNAQIGLMAFAVGFAGGIPAALLLFSNGLLLGAFAQLYGSRGLAVDFWAWVLPHGTTELTAVALCGAAGLALGQAVVFPGREERLAGLARRGREAAVLVLGAVGLFFVAGLVEGIFRQLVPSIPGRYAMAFVSATLWVVYFGWVGRQRP